MSNSRSGSQGADSEIGAEDWKTRGSKYFYIKKFSEAIKCYSKALQLRPNDISLMCNRILCHLRCQEWEKACAECRAVIEIDRSSIKAHYFYGCALLELKQYDEAIGELTKAQELARDQHVFVGEEAASAIRAARKRRWAASEEHNVAQQQSLREYLDKLVREDKQRQFSELPSSSSEIRGEAEIELINSQTNERLNQINTVFNQLDERRRHREVPECLCDRISFEIMRDPVITPSGISYDRRQIEEHLNRVGHFDPVTRAPLTAEHLIPNLSLKEVIDAFLEQNPWAEEY